MSTGKSLGQVCYESYREQAGGVSLVSGQQLPAWEALPAETRAAWESGAGAVARAEQGDENGVEYRG